MSSQSQFWDYTLLHHNKIVKKVGLKRVISYFFVFKSTKFRENFHERTIYGVFENFPKADNLWADNLWKTTVLVDHIEIVRKGD